LVAGSNENSAEGCNEVSCVVGDAVGFSLGVKDGTMLGARLGQLLVGNAVGLTLICGEVVGVSVINVGTKLGPVLDTCDGLKLGPTDAASLGLIVGV
jgi:hypothetical protein